MNRSTRLAIILGVSIGAAVSAWAGPYTIGTVTVTETGTSPAKTVQIISGTLGPLDVYAGITELTVDGVPTNSFCIDPYQYSNSSAQPYTVASLASAPSPTGGMGSDAALIISNLWAENYQAALGDDPGSAAGLQIAIWEEVASGTGISFLLAPGQSDYGASTMIAAALAADSNGVAPVSLVALSNTTYQDYVVQNVPDSGMTLVLLGFGLASLAIVGRKARPVPITTD